MVPRELANDVEGNLEDPQGRAPPQEARVDLAQHHGAAHEEGLVAPDPGAAADMETVRHARQGPFQRFLPLAAATAAAAAVAAAVATTTAICVVRNRSVGLVVRLMERLEPQGIVEPRVGYQRMQRPVHPLHQPHLRGGTQGPRTTTTNRIFLVPPRKK